MRAVKNIHRILPALLLLFALGSPFNTAIAQARYPGREWDKARSPETLGWSSQKLKLARRYSESTGSAAVMIVVDGVVKEGKLDLSRTLEELGIDDGPPKLTAEEKQARVIDLLKARSGVYHPALGEIPAMQALRPQRGSHKPGTFWYYNNWDFNVLGTIFERSTGTTIREAFAARIARPLMMQDFRPQDVEYVRGEESVHPIFPFRMSARDAARFGLLYLRKGEWQGARIVPEGWVEESTRSHSLLPEAGVFGTFGGYGYMWWVAVGGKQYPSVDLREGAYSAHGYGGHFIVVIPHFNMVVVHRNDTERVGPDLDNEKIMARFGALLRLILESRLN
ncbi:MAG TPA: serine hydrolase [Blastocatellia bacterium]|nr:serine hydrolase [Blastocatellia bacterium]